MLKGITIGQHYPLESVLHSLDPRTKLLAVIVYMVALFSISGAIGFTLMLCFSMLAIQLSKIPKSLLWRSVKSIRWMLYLTFFLHAFTADSGPELIGFGPWIKYTSTGVWIIGRASIYAHGVLQGLFMSSRLALMVMTTSLLTLTTSPIALTDGLEHLLLYLKPLGVPAHELAMMMTIALRFIPTLIEEADKIMKAQTARGADFDEGNLIQRMQSLLPLLVPLFVNALRRADDLALAMEARCYDGSAQRGHYRELAPTWRDTLVMVVLMSLLAVVLGLNWSGMDRWWI